MKEAPRHMKKNKLLPFPPWGVLLALALGSAPFLPARALGEEAPATISFAELERGQKGYGLSVFAGTKAERFEVEVLGVQRSTQVPGLDFLITRLSGQGLEKSGVAGGMSGSPVYFEGRLAGAVAFSYLFASEPIAGITPIGAMRAIPGQGQAQAQGSLGATEASHRNVAGLPRVKLEDLLAGHIDHPAFEKYLSLLSPGAAGPGRSALVYSATGFGGEARRLLESRLGPLAPSLAGSSSSLGLLPVTALGGGGKGSRQADRQPETPAQLEPGDSVAMVMVRGDLSMAAVGTLTDRQGADVVAFGHPVFGGIGPVRFPLAGAEVVTVMPGLAESFKIANVGTAVGSFLEDRSAGSRGVLGPVPPMTPLAVKVFPSDGGAPLDYHMDVTSEPLFRPILIAVSTLGSITAAGRDQGAQSMDISARFALRGRPELRVEQSFAGGQAAIDAALQVMQYAVYLAFNDFEPVEIEGVDVEVHLYEEERRTRVLAAWPERRKVAPGETLGLYVELEDYRGERRRRHFDFPIPADVSGRFYLMIGDGGSTDAAYAKLEKTQPETLSQGLEQLRRRRSTRNLHLFGLDGGSGISIGGHALPDLPGSRRALFGAAADTALPWRIVGEKVIALDRPAEGMVRIDLEVERRP